MTGDQKNDEFGLTAEIENVSRMTPMGDELNTDSDDSEADYQSGQDTVENNESELLRRERDALASLASDRLELAQRTQAEMDNLRKRTLRDIENAHKYALEKFISDLLPIMDSLELGIQASETATDITSLQEGMDLTLKKFSGTLEKFGAVVVNPDGEKFNPEKHEAVSMTEAAGVESGTVIAVLQKGYELNGRLVRPAIVVVAK